MIKLHGNLQKTDLEIYTALSLYFLSQEVSLFMLLHFDPTGGKLIVSVQFISGLLLQHAIPTRDREVFWFNFIQDFYSNMIACHCISIYFEMLEEMLFFIHADILI